MLQKIDGSVKLFTISVLAVGLSACEHGHKVESGDPEQSKVIVADAGLDATEDPTFEIDDPRRFKFNFSSAFSDKDGNFNFAVKPAEGNDVKMIFTLDKAPQKLLFKEDPRDAMWIIEKGQLYSPTDSPQAPYIGNQFYDFSVSKDRRTLTVMNRNDDKTLYRYNLRFDFNNRTIQLDPDTQNGGAHDG